MKLHGGLFGKQRAKGNKFELTLERVELLRANMLEQCIRFCIGSDVEVLAKAGERRRREPRRAISSAANIEELSCSIADTPCV